MVRTLVTDRKLWTLLGLALIIKLFSLDESRVERYYTDGFYPWMARGLRTLTGWVPFSLGDLLYAAAFLYLIFLLVRLVRHLRARTRPRVVLFKVFRKLLFIALSVYLIFNIFWGLNYDRLGIAEQFGLKVEPYEVAELQVLTEVLVTRLQAAAPAVTDTARQRLDRNGPLFDEAVVTYSRLSDSLPFLAYRTTSLKPSMYSHIGHFFGFTGYYNPFSGEAQIKTTVPFFLKPFVICHEIGHQLGYGKENEANFVSYLACRRAPHPEFRYSGYLEMYLYAHHELYRRDSARAIALRDRLPVQAKQDISELQQYLDRSDNLLVPYFAAFYNQFLKLNNQPKGKESYNQVVAWLIAYQKKYGPRSI
ncbi:MAG TPA: DUF3810 domain-containing protein [Chitinophagaceae bacterium]|jgi:hypothetical protein|nr:DUF3810 domain-containing protein [Chitinophagaceae bacterium]